MKPMRLLLLCLILAVGLGAGHYVPQDLPTHTDENLHAVLWMQTAGEYEMLTRQSFALAELRLQAALQDPNWTAAREQEGQDFASLPPAIICDLDETILDNGPFQAQLLLEKKQYTFDDWHTWCNLGEAAALPGAVAFLQAAAKQGVTVFYITNRDVQVEPATRRNLEHLQLPLPAPEDQLDTLLTKGEQKDWTSNKSSRRQLVAQTHRILLLLGDDLNDFDALGRTNLVDRQQFTQKFASYIGSKWIVIPNPVYGSWEQATFDRNNELDRTQQLARKYQLLKGFRQPSLAPTP